MGVVMTPCDEPPGSLPSDGEPAADERRDGVRPVRVVVGICLVTVFAVALVLMGWWVL